MSRLYAVVLSMVLALFASAASVRAETTAGATLLVGAPISAPCQQWGGYPWVQGGCYNSSDVNAAFNLSPSASPPQNAFGQGAQQGKYWLDTSTGSNTPTLRQCLPTTGCSTAYVSSQWLAWGTYNITAATFQLGASTIGPLLPSLQVGTLSLFPTPQAGSVIQFGSLAGTLTAAEWDSYGAPNLVRGLRWDGTPASPTALVAGDEILSTNAWGYNGTSMAGPTGAFSLIADQNWALGSQGTRACVKTTTDGTTTLQTQWCVANDGGLYYYNPTGSPYVDEGPGTVNASGYYVNGVLVTSIGSATLPLQITAGVLSLKIGTSVVNPGSGTLEAVLPTQTITGAANTTSTTCTWLWQKTRRSNSGSAMADTLPGTGCASLVNGARLVIANADASAADALSAGPGTSLSSSCASVPAGQDFALEYDGPNATWRGSSNTCAVVTTSVSQSANRFLAAPNGSAGDPSFRTIVGGDMPAFGGGDVSCSAGGTPCTIADNYFSVSRVSSGQTLSSGIAAVVVFDTVGSDSLSGYSTSTGRYTPNLAGHYFVCANVTAFGTFTTAQNYVLQLLKNGAFFGQSIIDVPTSTGGTGNITLCGLTSLNGSTDYLTVSATVTATSPSIPQGYAQFSGYRIGP
jgi:hypothetical protein